MFVINRHAEESKPDEQENKKRLLLENLKRKAKERKVHAEQEPEASKKRRDDEILAENVEKYKQNDKSGAFVDKKTDVQIKGKPEAVTGVKLIDTNGPLITNSYDPLKQFKLGIKNRKEGVTGEQGVTPELPEWFANPCFIKEQNGSSKKLQFLSQTLQDKLNVMGINQLLPVQHTVIPAILHDVIFGLEHCLYRPNDICVCSPTGSGKTLTFALPLIEALLKCSTHALRVLVVLPTIELATQVHSVFTELSNGHKIKCVLLGGKTIAEETKMLEKFDKYGTKITPDVVVATPGRLVNFLETPGVFDFSKLRFLVIDEVDRMMNFDKQSWLKKLKILLGCKLHSEGSVTLDSLSSATIPVQKLLFSATLTADLEKLEQLDLFQPRLFASVNTSQSSKSTENIMVPKFSTPLELKEYKINCTAGQKPLILIHFMTKMKMTKVLCFTSTTDSAHRLFLLLKEYSKVSENGNVSFTCAEFSSQLTKRERKQTLHRFKTDKINILVCSDSMARGIDVANIEQVILYDSPHSIEAYIHRIGRTSRAGKEGSAYTLMMDSERMFFKEMLQQVGRELPTTHKIPKCELDKHIEMYELALKNIQSIM